jgi:hypothetical protein
LPGQRAGIEHRLAGRDEVAGPHPGIVDGLEDEQTVVNGGDRGVRRPTELDRGRGAAADDVGSPRAVKADIRVAIVMDRVAPGEPRRVVGRHVPFHVIGELGEGNGGDRNVRGARIRRAVDGGETVGTGNEDGGDRLAGGGRLGQAARPEHAAAVNRERRHDDDAGVSGRVGRGQQRVGRGQCCVGRGQWRVVIGSD